MMGFGIVYMLVFWVAVIGIAMWLLSRLFPRGASDARTQERSKSPLAVLKRRYARGELSQDEYEEMRDDLSE